MIFNYNYFKNLEDFDFYLCNPDGEELYSIAVQDVNFSLRFNDISTLTFNVSGSAEDADGNKITQEYYDLLETRRLIYVNNIGWFTIRSVVNTDNGYEDIKSIEAESLQATFKDRGFVSEERVYCIYNTADSYDAAYDPEDEAAIPSVVGQMYQQLGINQVFITAGTTIESAYDEWTIIHVDDELKYDGDREASDVLFRTMNEETTFGYDWLVNSVENAFGIVIDFDFLYKTIEIKTVANTTKMSDACLSFSNVMNTLEVTEDASNIVTVLSCTGKDIDITEVNPTGTNYVADFSYYMDEDTHKWMSSDLIQVLKDWKIACNNEKTEYETNVTNLYNEYKDKSVNEKALETLSFQLTDLKAARDNYYLTNINSGTYDYLRGIVIAETVDIGGYSRLLTSDYNKIKFTEDSTISFYTSNPQYNVSSKTFYFDTSPVSSKVKGIALGSNTKIYFFDTSAHTSYCVLNIKTERIVDGDEPRATYTCSGFTRYITLNITEINRWIDDKEKLVRSYNSKISSNESKIAEYTKSLSEISNRLNLLKYVGQYTFPSGTHKTNKDLLRELTAYWIEGDYTNENISAKENDSQAEIIKLSNELLKAGRAELEKVSQPRYSFTVSADAVIGAYELKDVVGGLTLGSVITTERKEGVWYYPALLEMSFSLGEDRTLSLSFANALRLDDWGYTFADLVSGAANTSRKVSANWQNLMEYARDKASIEPLIKNPLDATLRASFSNLTNQEFQVDSTGILGRKKKEDDSGAFENEQLRILNNLIIFTNDGWNTAKAAFGKISYTSGGATKTSYGLIADTIVGTLLLGETLKISNGTNTITLDKDGITVRKGSTTSFMASTAGDVTVSGTIYSSAGKIGGWSMDSNSLSNDPSNFGKSTFMSTGTGYSYTIGGHTGSNWCFGAGGKFGVNKSGELYATDAHITGAITATSGSFTGTINATDGYFKGEINATSGSFSTSLKVAGRSISSWMDSSGTYAGYPTIVYAKAGSIGNWHIASATDLSYPSCLYGEYTEKTSSYVQTVYFHPSALGWKTTRPYVTAISTTWDSVIRASNNSSDRYIKHDIKYLADDRILDGIFDCLQPCEYKFNQDAMCGDPNETHYGFIAQDVQVALGEDWENYAFVFKNSDRLNLLYKEFIPLNTWQIKKLKARVSELEDRIKILEDKDK